MQIRVLGAVEVRIDGRERQLGGPKQRLLLAALLVHRRTVVSLDLLVDAMWGDSPPPTARATMQTHLSKLRRTLADVDAFALRNAPPGYLLDIAPHHLDADRFETTVDEARAQAGSAPLEAISLLDEALGLWEGPAFAEFADEPWASGESARLEELRLTALEARAETQLRVGSHGVVVEQLASIVPRHPFRERLWGQLMLALHRSGRQGEALRAANRLRRHLGDELGLEPSVELCELERAIAADDPALRLAEPVSLPAGDTRRVAQVPPATTALVGRAGDLDELATLVATIRLLTLTGPGGVGKSSLAMELARRHLLTDPRGVGFVELAAVRDDAAVTAALAQALDIERRLDRSLEESVIDVLGSREMLLVLDNCEHVLDAVGALVQQIIRWCPGVRLIATSREPIGMAGERLWPVAPLEVPSSQGATRDAVVDCPAVQVFVARARDVRPGFEVTDANAAAVAELCIQLDGVPLALELAGARMASMSPDQLASRLHERFVLLGGGHARDPRHRTLFDLVQWSYELLSPTEQTIFDRLSVFVDGFDLDSAEQVCGVGGLASREVATPLTHLVEKSLVIADHGREGLRHRQLETLRQYGSERLATRPEVPLVRRAHLTAFVALAERAGTALDGPGEQAASAQLEVELGNLRTAVTNALLDDDADNVLRLVAAVREWAFRRIRYEVIDWAERAVALDGAQDHELLPTATAVTAYGSFVRGELDRAVVLAEAAVDAHGRLGVASCGLAERVLGNALFYRGDHAGALAWMDRMVDAAVASGGDGAIAHAFYMRSVAQTSVGDFRGGAGLATAASAAASRAGSGTAEAQALYAAALAAANTRPDESIALLERAAAAAEAAGNRWMGAFAMTEAMWLTARFGDTRTALVGYGQVVETWYRGGDWANQWLSLRQLAGTLATAGRDEEAALILGAVDAAGASSALPFAPSDADDLQLIAGQLRARLGPDAADRARRQGGSMRDDMVVNGALDAIAMACGTG